MKIHQSAIIKFALVFMQTVLLVSAATPGSGQNPVANSVITDKSRPLSKRNRTQLFAALHLNRVDYGIINEAETPFDLAGGINYLVWKNMSVSAVLNLGVPSEEKKDIAKDQDIYDNNNKKVRLVERTQTKSYSPGIGLELDLGYSFFPFNKEVRPFVGVGYRTGEYKINHYMMTDREHWALFSEHNRYNLDTSYDLTSRSLVTGVNIHPLKNFLVTIRGEYIDSRINANSTTVSTNGESYAFTEQDYAYAQEYSSGRYKEYKLYIGFGAYFDVGFF